MNKKIRFHPIRRLRCTPSSAFFAFTEKIMKNVKYFILFFALLVSGNFLNASVVSPPSRNYQRITVEDSHAAKFGLKVLRSERLTLVTDMEITSAVKHLSKAVDAAYSRLCAYFGIPEDDAWRMTAFLMKDKKPFVEAGYFPAALPAFKDGFAWNSDCWLYDQPSDYYRQHLLIHEMTHCFMLTTVGNVGPLWMTEGFAEFFGMHEMSADGVKFGIMPPNKESVPFCARIRELRDETAAGRARTLWEVMRMNYDAFQNNEVYVWSWAAMWFLANHPDTKKPLAEAGRALRDSRAGGEKITDDFLKSLGEKLPEIEKHWMMFVAALDYGFSLEPMLFDAANGEPLDAGEKEIVIIRADHGWQNSGIRVEKGDSLRIRALGAYELGNPGEKSWPCEPGGVSIRYFRGNPRGMLLAAVCPDETWPEDFRNRTPGTFFSPISVGLQKTFTAEVSGTLMFQINDSPRNFENNSGTLKAEVLNQGTR